MDQYAAENWIEKLEREIDDIESGYELAQYLEQHMILLRQFMDSPASSWSHPAIDELYQWINGDWVKTQRLDFPRATTAEDLIKILRSIGRTPEEFLASPAAMPDDDRIHELRRKVWGQRLREDGEVGRS